jgi:GTPase SAR1 family protein
VIVGDSRVGKTCILHQMQYKCYPPDTGYWWLPTVFGSFVVDVEIGTKIVSWIKKSKFSARNIYHTSNMPNSK